MKIKKRYIVLALLAGAAVFGAVKFMSAKTKPSVTTVAAQKLQRKDIRSILSLKAPLEGTESIELVSNLHYEITSINVKEGDKVKKGQVLAVLNREKLLDEIQTQKDNILSQRQQLDEKLTKAQNAYDTAKKALDEKVKNRQQDYEKAQNALSQAKRKYENIEKLYANGAESREELLGAQKDMNDCQSVFDGFTVKNGKVVADESEILDIEQAQSGVTIKSGKAYALDSDLTTIAAAENDLKIKEKSLDDCDIKSTIDGTVTRVNTKVGRFADKTDNDKPMFIIENLNSLQMKVAVSEYDIDKVKLGQTVEIKADVLGSDMAKGTVSRISPTGEIKSSSSSERVIPVQIDILPDERLISGINATAGILTAESKNALCVPLESLFQDGEGKLFVFRVNSDSKTEKIPVTAGVENDTETEVISDSLNEGDNIIVSPDNDIPDGTIVALSDGGEKS